LSFTSMLSPEYTDFRKHIETIYLQALQSVDPYKLVQEALRVSGRKLTLDGTSLDFGDQAVLYLIALGKAAGRMTKAALDVPGLHFIDGVVALPEMERLSLPARFKLFHAGHPHPTQASIDAGHMAKKMLAQCTADDIVFVLISGGGSALFELPIPGIELADLHQFNQQLLRAGLPIQQVNIIRSALSQTKAGGLARMAAPARVVALILSDVIGDPLSSIASGPTVLTPDRRNEALQLLKRTTLWLRTPARIRIALEKDRSLRPKVRRPVNVLLAGNRDFIRGALVAAQSLGFKAEVLSRQMHGEARQLGRVFARRLLKRSPGIKHPTCFIMGGETTVTVQGTGKGGRNQEFALAGATTLDGHERIAIASLASDGRDGPTDAAGAIITGATIQTIRRIGLDPDQALDQNDAYHALNAGNALLKTGPTGTNVADIVLGLIYPETSST
jgi:glycerate 2-kinase